MHPVLVQLGSFRIYSYGVLIALGGALSCRFWWGRRARLGIAKDDDFWLLVNTLLVCGFVGGRVLFLLEYTRLFSPEFWDVLLSFSKGFSVLGAFVGVTAGLWWFARRVGTPFRRLLDYVCAAAPLWHAFGRFGCLMAGCCFGRPTDVPWAVTFRDPRAMIDASLLGLPVHPTQLYEAAGDLLILAFLRKAALPSVEAGRQPEGTVAAAYFAGYAALRFVVERYRGDTVAAGPVTAGQAICLAMLAGAAGWYLYWRGARAGKCIPS